MTMLLVIISVVDVRNLSILWSIFATLEMLTLNVVEIIRRDWVVLNIAASHDSIAICVKIC